MTLESPNADSERRYCPGCGGPWPYGEALPPGHEHCLCVTSCDEYCLAPNGSLETR